MFLRRTFKISGRNNITNKEDGYRRVLNETLFKNVKQLSNKSLENRKPDTIIFDVAGTIADEFVMGVEYAFITIFNRHKIKLTGKQARGPTGIDKYRHMKEIFTLPEVKQQWFENYNRYPTETDITELYKNYAPFQIKVLNTIQYTKLIPNTLDVIHKLSTKYNMLFGITTGYTEAMMEQVLKSFQKQGFIPNSHIASDQVPKSRPHPDGIMKNLQQLKRSPLHTIKIGDTPVDIEEGNNAGCITIGIVGHSNKMGECVINRNITTVKQHPNYYQTLNEAYTELKNANPDYIIYDITSLEKVIDDIYIKSS